MKYPGDKRAGMITRTAFIGLSMAAILLPGHVALAVEPLSIKELTAHCKHYPQDLEGADAIFCVRYIQGFIDGAVATDERVALNVAAEFDQEETYQERALRTRSQRRLALYGPTVYAEFCLGAPLPLKEVVQTVVHYLNNRVVNDAQVTAGAAVYQSLRKAYPCIVKDER